MTQALQGFKVLDLSMGVAGPYAGMLCAQHGADVTKIEPHTGDWGRGFGTRYGDLTAPSTVYNRGKRSLSIDLKDEGARAVVSRMADEADVVLESFRPGVIRKFGMDYASVRSRNPKVVYLSVSGFGQTGPMTHLPATDIVLQAFSGFMDLNKNRQGLPQRLDLVLIDIVTGLYGFQGITTGLLQRARFGEGKYIDCSLMNSAMALQAPRIIEHTLERGIRLMYAPIGVLPTRDGSLVIGVMHEHHFVALCRAIGREELANDPRYDTAPHRVQNEAALMELLGVEFRKHTTDEMVGRLEREGVLHSRVQDYAQLLKHPQVAEANAVTWLRQDGIGADIPLVNIPGAPPNDPAMERQAPHRGQHSTAVLRDWGVPQAEIDAMLSRGAVTGV